MLGVASNSSSALQARHEASNWMGPGPGARTLASGWRSVPGSGLFALLVTAWFLPALAVFEFRPGFTRVDELQQALMDTSVTRILLQGAVLFVTGQASPLHWESDASSTRCLVSYMNHKALGGILYVLNASKSKQHSAGESEQMSCTLAWVRKSSHGYEENDNIAFHTLLCRGFASGTGPVEHNLLPRTRSPHRR